MLVLHELTVNPYKCPIYTYLKGEGEASMSSKCVLKVTYVKLVDKKMLRENIGVLSKEIMAEVYDGITCHKYPLIQA